MSRNVSAGKLAVLALAIIGCLSVGVQASVIDLTSNINNAVLQSTGTQAGGCPAGWVGSADNWSNFIGATNQLPTGCTCTPSWDGGGFFSQTLSIDAVAGQSYTVTVGVACGGQWADMNVPQVSGYTITLSDGTTTFASANGPVAGGNPYLFYDIPVTGTATANGPLTIRVAAANAAGVNTAWTAFQDVRLTTVASPEPATMALLAIGGIGALLRRRK
jgi:hypothetical protein